MHYRTPTHPLEWVENRARWNLFDSSVRWSRMTFVFQRMTRFNEFNEHPEGRDGKRGRFERSINRKYFSSFKPISSTGRGSVVNLFHTFMGINQIAFAVMLTS